MGDQRIMTDYLFRVLLIVPSSRKAGLDAFVRDEFDDTEWLIVELSPTGTAPTTHYATCFACTMEQSSRWAERLATDGGVSLPPEFQHYDADQRIQFITAARPALKANTGVTVYVCRNDGEWFDVEAILAGESLKRIGEVLP
jgi:hypothetical protein